MERPIAKPAEAGPGADTAPTLSNVHYNARFDIAEVYKTLSFMEGRNCGVYGKIAVTTGDDFVAVATGIDAWKLSYLSRSDSWVIEHQVLNNAEAARYMNSDACFSKKDLAIQAFRGIVAQNCHEAFPSPGEIFKVLTGCG